MEAATGSRARAQLRGATHTGSYWDQGTRAAIRCCAG